MSSNEDEGDCSSSADSIEELSDTENEDDSNADYTAFSAIYMKEITNILGANSHVNCENALLLNKEMQQRLHEVRTRLQGLLEAVKQRFLANEDRLKLSLGVKKERGYGMRGAYLKGATFYFKGNMFFKDLNCRSCPNNPDYEYRKDVEGEVFPMDFELCSRHVWSLLDKKAVVQGVKEQVLDYLNDHLNDHGFQVKNNKCKKMAKQIRIHTEKLSALLEKVDENFTIDWNQISAHNLKYRHPPSSCKAMWQVYLCPSLKRSAWTDDENKQLLQAAQKHNYQNWENIAKSVPRRSDYQCFIQYQTRLCFTDANRYIRWDKRDDAKLLDIVQKKTINGVINWNAVAVYFPQKPKKSLHQRYQYYLRPDISHEPFTPEEDLVLLAAVEEYGEKFALIPRTLFPHRSVVQLRMRYKSTLKSRHKVGPWSIEDDKKLMEFVAENGTSSWLRCEKLLGNHTRTSCRTRFLTIQKFFTNHPDAAIEDIPRKKECTIRRSVITTENWVEKVAELRENPDVTLAPVGIREKRALERTARAKAEAEAKQTATTTTTTCQPTKTARAKANAEGKAAAAVMNTKKCRTRKLKSQKTATTTTTEIEPIKVELQMQKPPKLVKRIQPYIERLRANEQQLYHFFKYAYNFQLGTDVCTKAPNRLIGKVAASLDYDNGNDEIVANKQFVGGYTLPPSWSTTIAFRALCIQSAQLQLEQVQTQEQAQPVKEDELAEDGEEFIRGDVKHNSKVEASCDGFGDIVNDHPAVQRFRNRMFALFFQTALLSRLEPARFKHLTEMVPPIAHAEIRKEIGEGNTQQFTSANITEEQRLQQQTPQPALFVDISRVKSEYAAESMQSNNDGISVNERPLNAKIVLEEIAAENGSNIAETETAGLMEMPAAVQNARMSTVNTSTTKYTVESNRSVELNETPIEKSAAAFQQQPFQICNIKTECVASHSATLQPHVLNISTQKEEEKVRTGKSSFVNVFGASSEPEAQPAEKRICLAASSSSSSNSNSHHNTELKLATVKTEFE